MLRGRKVAAGQPETTKQHEAMGQHGMALQDNGASQDNRATLGNDESELQGLDNHRNRAHLSADMKKLDWKIPRNTRAKITDTNKPLNTPPKLQHLAPRTNHL